MTIKRDARPTASERASPISSVCCVHERFEAQAARTPDAVAVVAEGGTLSYASLNKSANQLAHYLRRQGIWPGALVGVYLDRTPSMVTALLAVLKCGAAYIPLDPIYPPDRIAFMLQDANTAVVLTQDHLRSTRGPLATQVVCLDRDRAAIAQEPVENLSAGIDASALAYVIYTSGSTGQAVRQGGIEPMSVGHDAPSTDIAVIGMSGRFPGAESLDEFWRNLRHGREGIRVITDAELLRNGVDQRAVDTPNYVKAAADLPGIECFDNAFFGFTPRDAQIMDPQLRCLLECAWATIEHAGYNVADYGGAIGVYAGAALNTYFLHNLMPDRARMGSLEAPLTSLDIFTASDALSTVVSFKLNLRGPSLTVQTACSTSLVAVHLACQSLIARESDMALAGGANLVVPQGRGYMHQNGMILSPDGHCRPFEADAAGTVFGSGVGLVLLKRLEEALADRNRVYAVIKGSAINNDGSTKAGFTAPSVAGQSAAIADALAIADVPADSISYVEAHGTGTALGDPIEVAALTQAFQRSTGRTGYCGIGSVKSNIGHLDRAAGVASLIKTVLSLGHKQFPATLHFERPNPHVDFDATPFYVVDRLTDWVSDSRPRRALVNSLGFGGTNDGMDSSRGCGIIVPVVKRPLRATAEEESRCNIQRSPLTSPSPCFKWRSRITRGVWMKSIG